MDDIDITTRIKFREKYFDRLDRYHGQLKSALKFNDFETFDYLMERMRGESDDTIRQEITDEIENEKFSIL